MNESIFSGGGNDPRPKNRRRNVAIGALVFGFAIVGFVGSIILVTLMIAGVL